MICDFHLLLKNFGGVSNEIRHFGVCGDSKFCNGFLWESRLIPRWIGIN
jgi:hypothetical protein